MVGGVLFFVHTPVQSCPYTRATRGQASLRSEIRKIVKNKDFLGFFRVLAHLRLIYGHICIFWYSMDLYRYCAANFKSFGSKEMVLRNFQVNDDIRVLAWLIEFSPLGNS